jgi:hypothetical protein
MTTQHTPGPWQFNDLRAALERINGWIICGSVVYYDDSTRRYYVCAAADLEDLCELMASDDEDVSRDAYSHWCAGSTHAEFETQADAEAAAAEAAARPVQPSTFNFQPSHA